jgi:hypothetical protein
MLLNRKTSLSCCQRSRQRRHNHQHHSEVGSMAGGTERRSHALARQQNPALAVHRLHSQLCRQPLCSQCRVPNLGGAGHRVPGAEVADPNRDQLRRQQNRHKQHRSSHPLFRHRSSQTLAPMVALSPMASQRLRPTPQSRPPPPTAPVPRPPALPQLQPAAQARQQPLVLAKPSRRAAMLPV